MISRERVCDLISYDPATGVFTRLKSRAHWVGKSAGKIDSQGARQILLDRQVYLAHRLAWLIMTGEWPSSEIDHRDGDPSNNAWANLRLATRSQNCQNRRVPRNKTGCKGLVRAGQQWRVRVQRDGERHVVHFKCFGKAAKYAARMRGQLHGDFANNRLAA